MADWSWVDLLPGVYVAFLAALLGGTLRRWYDGLPARVWAAIVVVLLLLFGEVLFGGKILLPLDNLRGSVPFQLLPPTDPHGNHLQGDLLLMIAPSLAQVRAAIGGGTWPLWNPSVGAGMPLLADPQAQAFQPLVLAATPFRLEQAAAITAALRVLFALVFFFLLLRRLQLQPGPALCGSLAYGLGGFLLLWLGWPLANVAAILPLVLYAGIRTEQIGHRRDGLLLTLATTSLLLAGHPETILYALLLAATFLGQRLYQRPAGERLLPAARIGLALLVAMLLSAPVLLPTGRYLPKTLRAARLVRELPAEGKAVAVSTDGASMSSADWRQRLKGRWLPIFAPNVFGNSRFVEYWGLENSNEDASGFVGSATLLAALLAFAGGHRRSQERLMLAVTLIALTVVADPPGLGRLLEMAPLPLKSATHHHRLLLLLNFGIAFLAACSVDRWRQGQAQRWPVLLLAAGLALLISWAYLGNTHPDSPETLSVLRMGWLRWQLRFLLIATLALLLGRGRAWTAPTMALLIATELLLAHRPANPPMPKRLAFPAPAPIRFLQESLGGERMVAVGEALPPNLAGLYGLVDIRTYNPMEPFSYHQATQVIAALPRGEIPQFDRLEHPLYSLLGVGYVLTPPGRILPSPLELSFRHPSGWIYRRPGALPRLFLPATAERSPATGWEAVVSPGGDPALRSYADDMPSAEPTWKARQPRAARLVLTSVGATRLRGTFTASERRLLASSVYQDDGWQLLADGRKQIVCRANGPFVAAWLDGRDASLELVYRPPGFLPGSLLAALGLSLALTWWVPPPRRTCLPEREPRANRRPG